MWRSIQCLALVLGLQAGAEAPPPAPSPAPALRREVRQVVVAWREAWERRDLAGFLGLYADDFAGREQLSRQKQAAFARSAAIEIGIEDLAIEPGPEPGRATVRFVQRYRSERHSDAGRKTLVLERQSSGWRIVREAFEGGH